MTDSIRPLGPERCRAILESALLASAADQTEATLLGRHEELTRFANNVIHQNVAETNAVLSLRAQVGRRLGTAATNDLSEAGIERAAVTAREAALRQPDDPHLIGLPGPCTPAPFPAFDDQTAGFTPQARARAVGIVCRKAGELGLIASGAFQTGLTELAVANSLGTWAYHPTTLADYIVTVMSDDSAGRAQASAWKVGELNPESIGDEALDKAARGRNPRRAEPGEYTVVVDPYVTEDLVGQLNAQGANAEAVQEGRSWMNDRMDQLAMSPLVSIWDDGLDPAGAPQPFDGEGVPKRRVDFVSKGVVGRPVYDSYAAAKEGKASTGHALPHSTRLRDWGYTHGALNLFVASGEHTLEDMIRSTQRGLYITRFWYTRPMRPRDCTITGMTRDGLFMIENGEIAYPVKNLRFTQSYVQALGAVEMVGRDSRLLVEDTGIACRVPALKIGAFHFTGSTV